mmetsp:Transcript_5556/g.10896  ORF Transcript_5556/g.10896 Transcript_5556/m.10896 type:complete len:115 (-) Transcript_5556:347-691(-)
MAATATAAETRSVYRGLLRSVQQVFRGDLEMLTAARQEIRDRLEERRNVHDEEEVSRLQAEGREAAEFLKTSIMQAMPNEKGHIAVDLEGEHANCVVEPIVPGMELPSGKKKRT